MEIVQQIVSIGAVLMLLGAALWWLRGRGMAKFSLPGVRTRGPRRLELVERLTLTPQHSLCLVRLADKAMLIGLSPSQCTLLEGAPWSAVETAAPPRVPEATR
jgi:flagellar biogenesis protein FliO